MVFEVLSFTWVTGYRILIDRVVNCIYIFLLEMDRCRRGEDWALRAQF